jgi:uncharacterized membrane protein YedE/YeeE
MIEFISQPWPWYVAGPLIGLTVPLLLILGNKAFGISSSLRLVCAACVPGKIPFFQYDWKKEVWNLWFVCGVLIGGAIAGILFADPNPVQVAPSLAAHLGPFGISGHGGIVPADLFNWGSLLTLRGFLLMVVGGFLVGFGTRYAGGCTSGHSIMGIAQFSWPSLVATICFMAGGFLMTNLILPFILAL